MLKHFSLFTALILTVFVVGGSEYTEIFIEEVNILPVDDGGDVSWLEDIEIPLDALSINSCGDDFSCPVPDPEDSTPPRMVETNIADGETDC